MIDVPQWVLILEAAKLDPVRAAEIEEQSTQKWWARYLAFKRKLAEKK